MIIRKVELRHFGRFGEAAFAFRDGFNLIVGPNEAGKSTLMEAVPAVLFGVRDKERYRPWGRQGSCTATLELVIPTGSVRIEREILTDRVQLLEKDRHGLLILTYEGKVSPQGRSSERSVYLEHLERIIGHADEDLFRASLFFGQGSLEVATDKEVASRIKAVLSGFAEVDYDRVLSSLNDDYFTITRHNPWGKDKAKDRELEEVRQRMAELEQRWYEARSRRQRQDELQGQIAEQSGELTAMRNEQVALRRSLDQLRKKLRLEEQGAVLKRDFSRVEKTTCKVDGLENERQNLLRELARCSLPRELPPELPHWLGEAESIRKSLIGLQGEATAIQQQIDLLGSPPWKSTVILSALLLLISGTIGWMSPLYLRTALLIGGAATALLWGYCLTRMLKLNTACSQQLGRLGEVENRRGSVQQQLSEIEELFRHRGLPASAVEMVKMQKNLERHQQLSQRLKEVESALQVLDHPEELASERQNLTRELVVLAERMEQEHVTEGAVNLSSPDEIERRLQFLEGSISECERQLLDLTLLEAAARAGSVDLLSIEEEGENLREREVRLDRRREALALGFDLLNETVAEFRRTYVDSFAVDIGRYLHQVSRGRYDAVRLQDDFTPELQVRENEWRPLGHFSSGTGDAVYLAVRLALTRHLTRGRHLPLLLDDPLIHFDRQRLSEALKLLERIGSEHQLLLFSHSESLFKKADREGWHVVSLEDFRPQVPIKTKEKESDDGQLYLL